MPFCTQCGKQVPEGQSFCIYCGAPIAGVGSAPAAAPVAPTTPMPSQPAPVQPQPAPQPVPVQPQAPAQGKPPKKNSNTPIIVAVVVVVVLVIVGAALAITQPWNQQSAAPAVATQDKSDDKSTKSETGKKETTVKGHTPPIFTTVESSSDLPGDSVTSYYGATLVLDSDPATAWNEGADGDGTGEYLLFTSNELQRVTAVRIMGGYPKTSTSGTDIYYQNNRPSGITIAWDGGSYSYSMSDLRGEFQTFELPSPVDTKFIKITIDGVYGGTMWNDCGIAEVEFE